MDREQASALVRQTLHEEFAETRFSTFVSALLKRVELVTTELSPGEDGCVERCIQLAGYIDPRGEALDVLILFLNRELQRTEDRIALRRFAADFLRARAPRVRALLAACVNPGRKTWRFSFITLANVLESSRFVSVLAGAAARGQRIEKPFVTLLLAKRSGPELRAIEAAFGGAALARELCEACRELFANHHDALAQLGANETSLFAESGELDERIADVLSRYPFTAHEPEALDRELAVDPEVLGKVFENLLPESVRHASGTYYTPRVIVRYMCQQALAHYLSTHTPALPRDALIHFLRSTDRLIGGPASPSDESRILSEHAAQLDALLAKVKVCDPAVGCGAFAMGMLHEIVRARMALTSLLPAGPGDAEGGRSAAALKRHAIRSSIHGMDADRGAVLLTRLRLWLSQVVEDPASGASISSLGDRILQGDSLAWDLDRQQGGFDIIITNPPYVRAQERAKQALPDGDYDLYLGFTALALRLLANGGSAAFILPHKFFNARYGKGLRRALSSGQHVEHIVYFGDHQVFEGATSYVCLLFLTRQPSASFRYVKVEDLARWYTSQEGLEARFSAEKLTDANWNLVIGRGAALHERLTAMPQKLRHVTERIFQGVKTSADKIYIVERRGRRGRYVRVFCRHDEREYLLEPELLHPLVKGGDSRAYALQPTDRLILFPYLSRAAGGVELISEETLRRVYPRSWQYLCGHRDVLRAREGGKMDRAGWYGYGRSQALEVVARPKIFTPDLAPAAAFSFDASGGCFFTGGAAGGYGILPAAGESCPFLLGLLNSKVLDFCLKQSTTPMKGGWRSYEARYIRELPIPPAAASQRRIIEQRVESLLALRRDVGAATAADLIERWVNALVYELFFPQSLHAAGLHFFQMAEDAGPRALTAAEEELLKCCLERLSTVEEVGIIEGAMGRCEADIMPKMSGRRKGRPRSAHRR